MIHKISAGVGERMQYITHKYNDTTIRFVLNYVKRNTFTIFGIYRILMGIIVLIYLR